jgi:SAM-dependent methyltransferase
MTDKVQEKWVLHYKNRSSVAHVYPEGFVVRMFRSKFPEPFFDQAPQAGAKILDLSCGYGRNLSFLLAEGFEVYASEINSDIVERLRTEFDGSGIKFDVGLANNLPYECGFFDGVLACNSCYYIEEGSTFSDNLEEIARVIKPGGFFGGTALRYSHSIFDGAEQITKNCAIISNDKQGIRKNSHMAYFEDESQLEAALEPQFACPKIASLHENYAGFRRHLYYFTATKPH